MLRPVGIHDVRFLRDMLRHAYHWRLSEDSERPVYRYVASWGRPGDAGVLALAGPHEYGAAWYRLALRLRNGRGSAAGHDDGCTSVTSIVSTTFRDRMGEPR